MQGNDLVHRLRSRSYSFKIPDPLVEEAADEIERLRLTDEEREAVEVADAYIHQTGCRNTSVQKTLRGLLERISAT